MEKFIKSILKSFKLNESTLSTILGAFVIVIVGVLIFNYFKTGKQEETGLEIVQDEETIEEPGKIKFIKSGEGKLVPSGLPTTHKVTLGEDLWHIAEKYYASGYNWVDIVKENGLVNADYIKVDQDLKIPQIEARQPTIKATDEKQASLQKLSIQQDKYKVQKGDFLWDIAVRAYGDGYKWPEIAKANNISNPDHIEAGRELVLPR